MLFSRFGLMLMLGCSVWSCKPANSTESDVSRAASGATPPSVCEYTWEQKPGTTDYTTYDSFARRSYGKPDRPQNRTLLGSAWQADKSICEKARFLKKCFDKVVMDSEAASAKTFRAWAAKRGIHPALALMAKAEQETKLGLIPDSCRGGICNGIGIGQIITAFDERGRLLESNDKRWEGITFNILTNLNYSVRVLADKTGSSSSLWDLAYRYNGSGYARPYADKVVGFYSKLKSCGIY